MLRTQHVRLAARFAAHRFRALHPFEVQAGLLNACNLRCAYCRCPNEKMNERKAVFGLRPSALLEIARRG